MNDLSSKGEWHEDLEKNQRLNYFERFIYLISQNELKENFMKTWKMFCLWERKVFQLRVKKLRKKSYKNSKKNKKNYPKTQS